MSELRGLLVVMRVGEGIGEWGWGVQVPEISEIRDDKGHGFVGWR